MTDKAFGQPLPPRLRGLYHRVAKRLGMDASHVSRVARGERNNIQIFRALQTEMQQMLRRNHQARRNQSHEADQTLEIQRMRDTVKLVKVQLDTALLLLDLVAHSGLNWNNRQQSLHAARRGYNTAKRLLTLVRVTPSDARRIQKKIDNFDFLARQVKG